MPDIINTKTCLNCNETLKAKKGKRSKIFCNSTCRSNYWQRAKKLEDSGMSIEKVVSHLGKNFASKRAAKHAKPSAYKPFAPENRGVQIPKVIPQTEPPKQPLSPEILARIAVLEAEIKNPPRNLSLGSKMYINVRQKELRELKEKLNLK